MTYKRLIVGPGKAWPKEAMDTFLDLRPFAGVDLVHDLNRLPWPPEDNSFDEVSAIHVVEHLDSLLDFMNECWRVLKPGGTLYIETPLAGANPDLEFADPTHRRCYRKHSFINYFTRQGIEAFGYTDRAWCILHVDPKRDQPDVLVFHGTPLKQP